MGSAERAVGTEHIPRYPKGFIVLRGLQLLIAIICLGICAYSASIAVLAGSGLMIFTSLITIIIGIWLVTAHSCFPRAYNYWATLAFDIFLFIFWLVSFALLALQVAILFSGGNVYCADYYYCYDFTTYSSILAAAAGLGAINFLFFFISLVIHSVAICRHRRAGLHSSKVKGTEANAAVQMTPQANTNYAVVPPQGIAVQQQEGVYNPQPMYSHQDPANQQQMYNQQDVPDNQHESAYISQQTYKPVEQGYPPQTVSPAPMHTQHQQHQGHYPPYQPANSPYQQTISPIASQPTGSSFQQSTSPETPSNMYEAPSEQAPHTGYQSPQHTSYQSHGQVPPNTYEAPVQHPQTVFEAPGEMPSSHQSQQNHQ